MPVFEKVNRPSNAIDTLVLRTIDQLMPEIKSRGLNLDLDLDHVSVNPLTEDMILAVRSLIINTIQWAGHRSDIAITLIDSPGMDTPGQWELEVCDLSAHSSPNTESWPSANHVLQSHESSSVSPRFPTIASAIHAASRCSGMIEAWHCPQGGIAMILVMPKKTSERAAA